jgi:hypothetical protein
VGATRLERLIQQIEAAFAGMEQPGDEEIVPDLRQLEDNYDLKGRHWRDLTAADILEHEGSPFLFTPVAYRFFLPAYLLAAVRDYEGADVAVGSIISSLTKRDIRDLLSSLEWHLDRLRWKDFTPGINDERSERADVEYWERRAREYDQAYEENWFLERMEPLTLEQKLAVKEFLQYMTEVHPRSRGPEASKALERYWAQFRGPDESNGSCGRAEPTGPEGEAGTTRTAT